MIRYIHIGDQIEEGCSDFAFYDTEQANFVVVGDEHVFDSPEHFRRCLQRPDFCGRRRRYSDESLLALLPEDKST